MAQTPQTPSHPETPEEEKARREAERPKPSGTVSTTPPQTPERFNPPPPEEMGGHPTLQPPAHPDDDMAGATPDPKEAAPGEPVVIPFAHTQDPMADQKNAEAAKQREEKERAVAQQTTRR